MPHYYDVDYTNLYNDKADLLPTCDLTFLTNIKDSRSMDQIVNDFITDHHIEMVSNETLPLQLITLTGEMTDQPFYTWFSGDTLAHFQSLFEQNSDIRLNVKCSMTLQEHIAKIQESETRIADSGPLLVRLPLSFMRAHAIGDTKLEHTLLPGFDMVYNHVWTMSLSLEPRKTIWYIAEVIQLVQQLQHVTKHFEAERYKLTWRSLRVFAQFLMRITFSGMIPSDEQVRTMIAKKDFGLFAELMITSS